MVGGLSRVADAGEDTCDRPGYFWQRRDAHLIKPRFHHGVRGVDHGYDPRSHGSNQ